MEETLNRMSKSLATFCNNLQSSSDALKQSLDRRPIPLGAYVSPFSLWFYFFDHISPNFTIICANLDLVNSPSSVGWGYVSHFQIRHQPHSSNPSIAGLPSSLPTSICWNPWPPAPSLSRSYWVTAMSFSSTISPLSLTSTPTSFLRATFHLVLSPFLSLTIFVCFFLIRLVWDNVKLSCLYQDLPGMELYWVVVCFIVNLIWFCFTRNGGKDKYGLGFILCCIVGLMVLNQI